MKITKVSACPIRMERGTHGNVGGGAQPDIEEFGDHYMARDAWTAIYVRRHETTLVRVETDSGLIGWGEAQAPVAGRAVKAIIDDLCAPVLMGRDPFDVEYLWYRMYSSMRERGHITGFFVDALAGIDLALYDLIGKAVGQPVHRLLGGRFRNSVPVYVGLSGTDPDAVAEAAREHVGYGYRALKLHLRVPNRELLEVVRALRGAVGNEIALLVDVHTTRDVSQAIELGRGLEELGVRWLEAPTSPESPRNHAEIARALDMQVATGEWLRTTWEWRQWIDLRAFDVAMPDIARTGLSEGKRIAALCDSYSLPIAPHVGGGGIVSVAASVQYSAAIPNFQILEHSHYAHEPKARVATRYPEPVNGEFVLDDTPGLGVDVDEAAVERFSVK